jgi:hypothetical protein
MGHTMSVFGGVCKSGGIQPQPPSPSVRWLVAVIADKGMVLDVPAKEYTTPSGEEICDRTSK